MSGFPIPKKIRIGDILIAEGKLSEAQLQAALTEQKKVGKRLGKVLVDMRLVSEDTLLHMLSQQLDIPFIDIKQFHYRPDDVCLLKETLARRFRVALLSMSDESLTLAMSDPTDIFCLDEIYQHFNKNIVPVIVKELDLLEVLDRCYGQSEKIALLAEELNEELADDVFDLQELTQQAETDDAPVVQLIQKIFEEALKHRASDIHIEPDEHVLRIRMRIDGVLSEQVMNEKRIAPALVVRLKLISGLDIAEKRLPQDGRFALKVMHKNVDVRLSTLPIQHGESVVMRLLVVDDAIKTLPDIGMNNSLCESFRQQIHRPHGLILVTGPTGSGKTTTLFAALAALNARGKKIITLEDPVEYRLPRVNQVQINEKIGLDFPTVLKSALRQDPDILLVGEIRDEVSANIALRAAMTGHLVLSSLHTHSAVSSVLRLLNMGVDHFVVASSLKAVLAQRLIRRLCPHCKYAAKPEKRHQYFLSEQQGRMNFYYSKGCVHCFNTGFSGRLGVFEYILIDQPMVDALRSADIAGFTQLAKASSHYLSLFESAMARAVAGDVCLDDVEKLCLSTARSHG
ncbi:MAG: GspE/PulE family protein [Cellvibrionaceae bacterium]|nr:GspE/PulE family protein [Cellvibrionaceae bacterium]